MPITKKFVSIMIVVIFIFLPYSAYGSESELEEFFKLKNRYYCLDKQQFKEISCIIDVPSISNIIKQFEPLKENIEIRESLSNFTLTYTPDLGPSFTTPHLDIILINNEGVADPEKLKRGIGNVKTGFRGQVNGVKGIIKGIFDELSCPRKENYKDLVFTKNEEGINVQYTNENICITEKFFGNNIETSQKGTGINVNSSKDYIETTNNKLILEKANVLFQQPAGTVKTVFLIKYQVVGNIIFPKNIKVVSEQTIQSKSQNSTFEINLINCKID
ncbi:MAG: hypothetical protein GY777_32675 [Candidatus Brocadiaceae bacterium]|nr:hypothetical protein [Candidatus Brocadiaceae bacterium]